VDLAGSPTINSRYLTSPDEFNEAKQELEEIFDDENDEIKRIPPPFLHHHLIARSWRPNLLAAAS
jgi:hypothetical protein